jgi:hypothetical protein
MDFVKDLVRVLLETGSRIATPLALAGFVVAAFTGTIWIFAFRNIKKVSQKGGLYVLVLSVKLLFVLALIAMLLGVASFVYLAKRDKIGGDFKAPVFRAFVNGLALTPNCYVTIPVTNNSASLDFRSDNIGNAIATGILQTTVNFPTNISVNAPSRSWVPTTSFNAGSNEKVGPGYYATYHGNVAPGDRVQTVDPIIVQSDNLSRTVETLFIRISSSSCSTPFDVPFDIHFTNGVGAPHSGF